jgi:hypothetical protein
MCELWGRRTWTERWEAAPPRPTPRRRSDERVSDADRDAVVAELRQHTAEGRLTLDEFEERVGDVFGAKTLAGLEHTRRELPSLGLDLTRVVDDDRDDGRRRRRIGPAVAGVLAAPFVLAGLVMVAVSLAVGAFVIWPLFVFGFLFWGGGGCGARPRHSRHSEARSERPTHSSNREPLVHA